VLPRIGLAPGYSLVDQRGTQFTSESTRGRLTLYTFAPTDCGTRCDSINATMAEVTQRVPDEVDLGTTEFIGVTIALDAGPTVAVLEEAAAVSGADGVDWRWIGGEETAVRNVVGRGFDRFYETEADGNIRFDPAFVIVDGAGVIRGEYRYQTVAGDADKLVHHVDILAEEIRYADGPAGVAYEAAHLFLCYP